MMKFKRITAMLLSAATLAAMPTVPPLQNVLPDTAVTAEAADTYVKRISVGDFTYEIYRDQSNREYAVITGINSGVTRPRPAATVKSGSATYPIRKIGSGAFSGNTKLVEMNLSDVTGLEEIGENAFKNSGIRYVEIGGNGTDLIIRKGAFENTAQLNYVYAYSGIKTLRIKENAFYNSAISDFSCYAKELTLEPQSFFYAGCGKSLGVYIYSGTNKAEIQTQAFWGSGLTNLSINSGEIIIRKEAFQDLNRPYNSSTLSYVTFNSFTKSIQLDANSLSSLIKLEAVRFNNSSAQLSLGQSTFSGSALKSINLPSTITCIPDECFSGCSRLTSISIPANVTKIGSAAFQGANLPQTVSISKNTYDIADDAFTYTTGVKSFSVASDNPNFISDKGVLYSKYFTKLLCYPQMKADPSYSAKASTIPDGAFNCNTYLTDLSITKLSRPYGEVVRFDGLSNLNKLTIPASDYKQKAEYIFNRYQTLLLPTKVTVLNGVELVDTGNGEPKFISKFHSHIAANCGNSSYDSAGFMQEYIIKMKEYVVNSVTTPSMSQVQKAVRLHQWICNRTTYDPRVIANDNFVDMKNQTNSSVFLHKETINGKTEYVTVCEGYARCYKILMEKAGIETEVVSGYYYDSNGKRISHAWNIVKLNGKWYHTDVTWDDQSNDERSEGFSKANRYEHFLCPDTVFYAAGNGHSKFNWESMDNPNHRRGYAIGITDDYYYLGDVINDHVYNATDKSTFDKFVNGTSPTSWQKIRGDLNFDGTVNSTDRSIFNSYLNSYKNTYSRPALWRFTTLEK